MDIHIKFTDMDLQTKKMVFIEHILTLSNENILDKLNEVLKNEWNKSNSESFSKDFEHFLDERISAHEKDVKSALTWEEVQAKIESRF